MRRIVWLLHNVAVLLAALFCGHLAASHTSDPTQVPEVELVAPASEDIGGLLFASTPTNGASGVRQIGKGAFTLEKGEWLFYQFTDAKTSYTTNIKTLSGIQMRLWSAEFAQLDNESLSALAGLTELRVLQFGISRGTSAEGLNSLSQLHFLNRLNVTMYDSDGLVALRAYPRNPKVTA